MLITDTRGEEAKSRLAPNIITIIAILAFNTRAEYGLRYTSNKRAQHRGLCTGNFTDIVFRA